VVVIPALNEEVSVRDVVRDARAVLPDAVVVVVDDGSTDGTAAAAAAAGAEVIRLPFNCGIGVAVQTGLRFAVRQQAGLVVRLDGDGQHDAGELRKLVAAVEAGADFAVGSRFADGAAASYRSSFMRRLGIRWFAAVLRLAGAGGVSDPTSGFFAANARAARYLAEHYASDYPEVDAVVRLARRGFRLEEVPVAMRARAGGISSINSVAAVVYMVKVTMAIAVSCLETAGRRPAA
jgi:glycosyltransferase involved in cell wall biosynthesis